MTDQQKPLTDEELAEVAAGQDWRDVTCHACGRTYRVERRLTVFACANHAASQQPPYPTTLSGPTATERLVAEVRRLRSDKWLRAAAEEIADKYESGTVSRLASAVLILRKHRDAEPKP